MSEPAAIVAVEEGDVAWWAGDRTAARRSWRAAVEVADATPTGRAAEAMARIRLLQVSGNLGPFVHEARLDRALADCPIEEPWCALAWADWELYMPSFVGANPARVPARLAGNPLPGAAARVRQATTGARPPDPGTWVLGVGLAGAPGAGIGATVRYTDPDLAGEAHRLEVAGAIDSLGGGALSAGLTTHGTTAWQVSGSAARVAGSVWFTGEPSRWQVDQAKLATGIAWRVEDVAVQVGGVGRVEDAGGGPDWLAGSYLGLTAADGPASARVSAEMNVGSYTHLSLAVDLRATPRIGDATLAVRVAGATAPLADTPFWRLPEAGGATLLRGAPAGRWRDETLLAAQVEGRLPLWGPLEGAVFVDTAHIDGWHVTTGGGIRIVLPPGRLNTTRLDVGAGPGSWGVVVGWGEAF